MIDVKALLGRIEYKPGWKFSYNNSDYTGEDGRFYYSAPLLTIQVTGVANSYAESNSPRINVYGQFGLCGSESAAKALESEEQFLVWLHKSIVFIETHETNEWLKVDGERPWDPHKYELHRNNYDQ